MKITLDIDKLLEEKKIDRAEYDKLLRYSAGDTGSLAFNILLGFGVIAVSVGALAMVPSPATAIVLGIIILVIGFGFLLSPLSKQWGILANICIIVGALIFGGGIVVINDGSILSFIIITLVFAAAGVFAKNGLLIVLSIFASASAIGARTGYLHATYFLGIQEPALTVLIYTILAIGLYQLSKRLPSKFEKLAIMGSRACVFLINFGFWIGSLWGSELGSIYMEEMHFVGLSTLALIITAIWAWIQNKRWLLNTVTVFGAIHFYTQWFENLGFYPNNILFAGIIMLVFVAGIKIINNKMKEKENKAEEDTNKEPL